MINFKNKNTFRVLKKKPFLHIARKVIYHELEIQKIYKNQIVKLFNFLNTKYPHKHPTVSAIRSKNSKDLPQCISS